MPSYYLPCAANLGDVQFTELSRKNLQIGSFDTTYADDVDVKNGSIKVSTIQFKNQNDPENPNITNSFLRCKIHYKNIELYASLVKDTTVKDLSQYTETVVNVVSDNDIENGFDEPSDYLGLHSEIVFYMDEAYLDDLKYDSVKEQIVEEYGGEEEIDEIVNPNSYDETDVIIDHNDIDEENQDTGYAGLHSDIAFYIDDQYLHDLVQKDELYWQDDYLRWLFEETINMSGFSNVGQFATHQMLSTEFPYTGNLSVLSNLPSKDETIPPDYDTQSNFFLAKSNLAEIRELLELDQLTRLEAFREINSIFNNTLGTLSYETEAFPKVNRIHVEEFQMLSDVVVGGYLYSSEIINTDELMNRNKIIWYDPFLNEDGSVKDHFQLVNNFLENNTDQSSVEISNIQMMRTTLTTRINRAQNNLDIDRVKRIISQRVFDGNTYLITSNKLTDLVDIQEAHTNLNIGSVAYENVDNAILENVHIDTSFVYKHFDDDDFTVPKYYICDDEGNLFINRIDNASEDNFGTVLLFNSFENMNMDYFDHEVPTVEFTKQIQTEVKQNITNVFNTLRFFFHELEDPPDGILDSNLTGYTTYDVDKLLEIGVYDNLEIPQVCYTGDFEDLLHIPTNVNQFNNDIPVLSKNKLFTGDDALDIPSLMTNLGLDNMCFQNHDTITITNGSATFNTLNPTEITIQPPIYMDITNYVLAYDDQTTKVKWSPLQIANEIKFGLVKIINSYQIDSREGVVPGTYVKQMKDLLEEQLNSIEEKLDQIEALLP